MTYKGLEWKTHGLDSPCMECNFMEFRLTVFTDANNSIDYGWEYRVSDHVGMTLQQGWNFETQEAAMREAIFDAMVLKLEDFN